MLIIFFLLELEFQGNKDKEEWNVKITWVNFSFLISVIICILIQSKDKIVSLTQEETSTE